MAKKTTVEVYDDLDGSKNATTVTFSLDSKQYEIDLSGKNEAQLRKVLEVYVAAATQVGRHSAATGRRKYGTAPARRDTKHIREWLRQQGVEISDRGRIPTEHVQRYEAAHAGG